MKSKNTGHFANPAVRKALLMRLAKWSIALIVALGLWRTIESARRQLSQQQEMIHQEVANIDSKLQAVQDVDSRAVLHIQRARWIAQQPRLETIDWWRVAAAGGIYLAGLFPAAFFFHQTLTHMKQRPRLGDSIRAHILGHMGKYVPGKAMVVVLRTGAISGPDVRGAVAMVAAFVETLLMMAVGGTVAGVLVLFLGLPSGITLLAIALAVCAAVPTLPSIFQLIVQRIARSRIGIGKGLDEALIDWRLMACGWGWMLLMWCAIGTAFALLIQAAPGVLVASFTWHDYLLATASIALAMVAGFLSLLPGGVGVRELVISTLLAPRFGLVPALVAAILARLVFLTVEVGVGGILWSRRRLFNRPDHHIAQRDSFTINEQR